MRLDALYRTLKTRFEGAGRDSPALAARMLIKAAAFLADADFIAAPETEIRTGAADAIEAMARRHEAGEPVSRILGLREFRGLPFIVTPDVLDPRPDTETLIDAAARLFADRPPGRVLDLGAGTGCIAIALLDLWKGAEGVAVDVSGAALDVVRRNAAMNGVADRLETVHGSWFDALPPGRTFDLIVSNPPYIPNRDIPNLDVSVRNFDPILALDGGIEGFDSYDHIFSSLSDYLDIDGAALFEIGMGQQDGIARLAEKHGLSMIAAYPDLAGISRVLEVRRGDK